MTRKELIEKLNDEFSNKHKTAIRKADAVMEQAKNNPVFAKTFYRLKELEHDIAKAKFEKSSLETLLTEKAELELKQKEILAKLKITENQLLPHFSCNKCNDTGYINDKQCQCFKARFNEELIKASGLETTKLTDFKYYDESIATEPEHKEALKKLKNLLLKYADKFPSTKYCNITLCGNTGVGKTFAFECFTTEIIKKGFTACFITAFQLNNLFLKYHTCFDANKQSYIDILLEPDLVVIDDLGTEPMLRNVTKEYLYLIISERMLKHKSTLISTNLYPDGILDRYGERVFSRLTNKSKTLFFSIEGTDLRQIKK